MGLRSDGTGIGHSAPLNGFSLEEESESSSKAIWEALQARAAWNLKSLLETLWIERREILKVAVRLISIICLHVSTAETNAHQ
jgi:hypothetical protein